MGRPSSNASIPETQTDLLRELLTGTPVVAVAVMVGQMS